MQYLLLKQIHIGLAAFSVAGFILRWAWVRSGRPRPSGWVRALPHALDTLFLGSAIALALPIVAYPAVHPFLATKVAGLVVYVMLGAVAYRRAGHGRSGDLAFSTALLVFAWVVSVARLKTPLGAFALLVT